MRRSLLPLLLAVPLAACVSLGGKAPGQLLSLTADSSLPAGTQRSADPGKSLIVVEPATPRKLDTKRIPVQVDSTSVAYVTGGEWVDFPRRLFRQLLSETVAAKTDRLVLDPDQFSGDRSTRLEGDLVEFGIDARKGQAVVTYDAILFAPDGATVMKRRFSASRPVSPITPVPVGKALDAAANDVATQVAAWVAAGGKG